MAARMLETLLLVAVAASAQPAAKQEQKIVECSGLNGVNENCELVLNAEACVSKPCSKLVLIFSGGEMGCVTGEGYSSVIADYSANGWAAACLNYFETSEGSAAVPYHQEVDRLNFGVAAATSGDWAHQYWTGEELLLEGISHGATTPPVVMARYGADNQTAWQGTRRTAGCFFDGSMNPAATAALLATGGLRGTPCKVLLTLDRWLGRYCPDDPAECDLSKNPDAILDNIEDVSPDNFHLRQWRLTECGSEMPACTADILPMGPQEKLCTMIDGGEGYSCDFKRLPKDSHLTCHQTHAFECREWFEGLPTNSGSDRDGESNDSTATGAQGFCSWSGCGASETYETRVDNSMVALGGCHNSQNSCEGVCAMTAASTWCGASNAANTPATDTEVEAGVDVEDEIDNSTTASDSGAASMTSGVLVILAAASATLF